MGKGYWIGLSLMLLTVICGFFCGPAPMEELPSFHQEQEMLVLPTTQPQETVEFPYVLRSAGLIVQHMAQYEGPFLEGDGEIPVSGVSALMIYNPKEQGILSAEVTVMRGGEVLEFSISFLPPKSRILVLEKNGKPYNKEPITQCICVSAVVANFAIQSAQLQITEENGQLQIQNLTEATLDQVMLYYKEYITEDDFYLGGCTRTAVIQSLEPGECRQLLPYGYAPGYSRVVWACCDT